MAKVEWPYMHRNIDCVIKNNEIPQANKKE
jgi:hypothetical protein